MQVNVNALCTQTDMGEPYCSDYVQALTETQVGPRYVAMQQVCLKL